MNVIPEILTVLSLLGVGALFGGALYDAVVLAPNLRGGPAQLEHGRRFMASATPANLFRRLAPACQALLLLTPVGRWSDAGARWPLLAALVALLACDAITFKVHYPRNQLLFGSPLDVPAERLDQAARQWASANLGRAALVLAAWLATLATLLAH